MSPICKVKAAMFVREHLIGIGLTRSAEKRIENSLALAFAVQREEIARQIEGTWGTADWMAVSKAVAKRVRVL